MKRILFSLLVFFSCMTFVRAQEPPPPDDGAKKEQKIKALYIAYMTQELKLSEEEAQKFWPIHSQFDAELRAVSLDLPELERQQSILNIKKKYQDKFVKILGNNRTNDFYRKDGEFRKKLVERLQHLKQQNNMNRRPPARRNQQ